MENETDLEGNPVDAENPHKLSASDKKKSDGRADFMKRFFSVAVSVGFASKIGEFGFLSALTFPSNEQAHQLILLIFAMVVVIGSWEFYFVSIDKRPLIDWPRFATDILIVSLYIILLLSVKNFDTFLFYITIIMLSYIIWDILSMRAFPQQYGIASFNLCSVSGVYINGALNKYSRESPGKIGPFITLWWFIVFVFLLLFHVIYDSSFYPVAIASAIAYISYRLDQVNHLSVLKRAFAVMLILAFTLVTKNFT